MENAALQKRVSAQIRDLPTLAKPALLDLWKTAFGKSAPPRLRRELMIPILAYRIQERAFGGLDPKIKARLKRIALTLESNPDAEIGLPDRMKPGTRLLREWKGELHTVTTSDSGFEYRDETYKSLSEIARKITGTRWSGPLFFGLRKASKK
jgi:hypothetical protein